MERIVIIGGKGTAINIAEQIEDAHLRFAYPMRVIGFAIDDLTLGETIAGFPVLCNTKNLCKHFPDNSIKFIFSLYRPDLMRERVTLLNSYDIPASRFANFIHPLAYVSPSAQLGYGNVILAQSCLHHGVRLGDNNVINTNVVIEHETRLKNSVFIAASASIGARVNLGTGVFVGLNSTVREDVDIANFAFVGMASAVLQSVEEGDVVYGVPGKAKK